jgi:hypothetical protein
MEKNCSARDFSFKGESFSSSNTMLDDFLMFRVAISSLTDAERMKTLTRKFRSKKAILTGTTKGRACGRETSKSRKRK